MQTGDGLSGWNTPRSTACGPPPTGPATPSPGHRYEQWKFHLWQQHYPAIGPDQAGGQHVDPDRCQHLFRPTTISGGTLQLGDGTSGHDATLATGGIVNNSAWCITCLAARRQLPHQWQRRLTKTGSGTLTLSGAETTQAPRCMYKAGSNSGLPSVANGLPITELCRFRHGGHRLPGLLQHGFPESGLGQQYGGRFCRPGCQRRPYGPAAATLA